MDWTVPEWLEAILEQEYDSNFQKRRHILNIDGVLKIPPSIPQIQVITAKLQWYDGGELIYSKYQGEGEFRKVYRDLFHSMFEPTNSVQLQLSQAMQATHLSPGAYAVAHYRAFWYEQNEPPSLVEQRIVSRNAVECASMLRPGGPIYFASDSQIAVEAIQMYALEKKRPVVVVQHPKGLIHLDRVYNVTKNPTSTQNVTIADLYSIFVDLLLMANGHCISHGDGGFGRYGSILSENHTCVSRHIFRHKRSKCQWMD
jgi:hypothetical protein